MIWILDTTSGKRTMKNIFHCGDVEKDNSNDNGG
jgi:hypothetical protein